MSDPERSPNDALLRDYERKRGRAMHHFNVLRDSVERFSNVEREAVPGEFDTDASQYVFQVPLEATDADWALRLGDFIYDTRASLDYLITALVRSTGKEESERSEFPIHAPVRIRWQDIDQWWEDDSGGSISRKLQDTPSGTKAALKTLQPFYGVPRVDPWRHPLWSLYVLSNRDKHRRLNLLAHRATIKFVDPARRPIFEGEGSLGRITETDEREAYTVRLTVDRQRDVDVYLLPTYDIRLHEPPELVGEMIETLAGINRFIDTRVLPAVATLLKPQAYAYGCGGIF